MKYLIFFMAFAAALPLTGQDGASSYQEEILAFRAENEADLVKGDRHPLEADDLQYLQYFEVNPGYRVACRFERIEKGKRLDIPTYSGITKPYREYGRLVFTLNGAERQLLLYQSLRHLNHPVYREYLFLPFKDWTNGEETYGGGRYIDIRMGELTEDTVYLDFNRAYNPWCAYSDGFNCPVPPPENHLDTEVRAGEMDFQKEK